MLLEDIKNNWKTDILGYAQVISSLKDTKYPAHTVKLVDGYGVAIPYSGDDVNESFSNVRIFSTDNIMASPGVIQRSLVLTTDSFEAEQPFASLCAEFIDPGTDGSSRIAVLNDPVASENGKNYSETRILMHEFMMFSESCAFYMYCYNLVKMLLGMVRTEHPMISKPMINLLK